MISYRCYKTCPVCGKTTLRLIEGTAERGLWECEGWRRVLDAWAGVSLVFPKEKCPGRVDEGVSHTDEEVGRRYYQMGTGDIGAIVKQAMAKWHGCDASPAHDLEAKEREFWEWVGETADCAGCPTYDHCAVCGDTLRAYYKRNFGGGR